VKKFNQTTFFLTDQFDNVRSGPGRFVNYLNEIKIIDFYILTDDIKNELNNIIKININKSFKFLPFYYIYKAYIYNRYIENVTKKITEYNIIFNTALLALFVKKNKKIKIITLINDPRHCNLFSEFFLMLNTYSIRKIISLFIGRFFEKIIINKTDLLVVNSEYLKSCILKNYNTSKLQIRVLHKFVDLKVFKPKTKFNFPIRNFLFLKNDYKRGNLETIINALTKVSYSKTVKLIVAGIDKKNIEIVRGLFIKYKFEGTYEIYGHLNQEIISGLYKESDCLLMPSKQESFGVVFLEAMASNVLIITRKVGGIIEILNNEDSAFFIKDNTSDQMVKILEKVNLDREIVLKKINNAHSRVLFFSKEKLISRFGDIINGL